MQLRCKKKGIIRDDDTWKMYCWDHRQGVTHQDCGCEYDNYTFMTVEWCKDHWKIESHNRQMVRGKGRRPKKPTKKQMQALAKRRAKNPKFRKVTYGEYVRKEKGKHRVGLH